MPTLTKFLDKKPTLVGRVDGISFYECPVRGDEAPLFMVFFGEVIKTDFYELPELPELYLFIRSRL